MKGEMNPRERWGLLLIDEFPDRPPVYPLVTSHASSVYGCDLIKYCTDGKILAEAQLTAQRRYGHEGLSVFTDVGIIAEAMGSRYHIREFEVPIGSITNGVHLRTETGCPAKFRIQADRISAVGRDGIMGLIGGNRKAPDVALPRAVRIGIVHFVDPPVIGRPRNETVRIGKSGEARDVKVCLLVAPVYL